VRLRPPWPRSRLALLLADPPTLTGYTLGGRHAPAQRASRHRSSDRPRCGRRPLPDSVLLTTKNPFLGTCSQKMARGLCRPARPRCRAATRMADGDLGRQAQAQGHAAGAGACVPPAESAIPVGGPQLQPHRDAGLPGVPSP
jgi:hypothetical protein